MVKRRTRGRDPSNKRLDLFLAHLQIEEEKRKQILGYVQTLTFETLKQKTLPKLRLNRP